MALPVNFSTADVNCRPFHIGIDEVERAIDILAVATVVFAKPRIKAGAVIGGAALVALDDFRDRLVVLPFLRAGLLRTWRSPMMPEIAV